MSIHFHIQKKPKGNPIHLITNDIYLRQLELSKQELLQIENSIKVKKYLNILYRDSGIEIFVYVPINEDEDNNLEKIRKQGCEVQNISNRYKFKDLAIYNYDNKEQHTYALLEGIVLSNYQFLEFKSNAKELKNSLSSINIEKDSTTTESIRKLEIICKAIYHARDLINMPHNHQSALQFSEKLKALSKEGMLRSSVYHQAKIEQLGMGGILAVNKGSENPATFTILEHKPLKPRNKQPIVLVGKGIVYDTGGLSLKPTPNSMDKMKSDMSGAAVVMGIMYVMGMLDIPLHIVALIPATDNRPGKNAYAPGDVIKMYSGHTVEVLNTDAEGRLILADALHYAKKYNPMWVADFATLTGAAANAIGDIGMVGMGTISKEIFNSIKLKSKKVNEKIAEFPLWDEYSEFIKSDIADLKNIGGTSAGAITAGKFLQEFTAYPWVHFDIAGVSFRDNDKNYQKRGGTGFGIRMMSEFLIDYSENIYS